MVAVRELGGVYEAGDGHELLLHVEAGGVDGLCSHQAVGHCLGVDGDALAAEAVGSCCEVGGRLVAGDDGIVGASLCHGACRLRLFLLCCLVGFFLRLDFLFGHGHLTIESHVIAVGEEEVLVVVAVPVRLEHGGNLVVAVALGVDFGVGYVVVGLYAAILGCLLVMHLEEQVQLVAVAEV